MPPLWRGSESVVEQPGSPRRTVDGQGLRVTRVFRGPYGDCLAAAPLRGEEMAGFSGLFVDVVDLVPDGAGVDGPGTLTIVLTVEEGAGATPADPLPTYEVEWTQLERNLRQHERYQTGGAKALTATDLAALKKWENEEDEVKRAAWQYTKADNTTGTLSSNAQDLAAKLLRGQTSYFIPSPVARRTSRDYAKPSTSTQGKREAPPGAIGAPSGYVWLKTADRAIRQGRHGKWERVEEWTGADVWDTDIYPAA